MAEMIPQSISANPNATAGEKKLFNILRDALIPDEDFLVWYEPKAINRYSDFIVWSQHSGLLVIEAKDWHINQIRTADPHHFKGNFYGKEEIVLNPLTQSRYAADKIRDLVKKHNELIVPDGERRNKPKFPVAHCVVLTNISRTQAIDLKIVNPQIIPGNQALFEDDLRFDVDDDKKCREFRSKLRQAFTIKFDFEPLTYGELKTLRYALFPEVHVNQLRVSKEKEVIKTLDLRQEQIAKSIGEGHRVLKGVAGSGKTLVLACRAAYLSRLHPTWRILVVCYNISLCQSLRQLIMSYFPESPKNNIEIFHIYGLVKKLIGESLAAHDDEKYPEWEERIIQTLKEAIESGKVAKEFYDAILVDEGQDFSTGWIQTLVRLVNNKTESFLFCFDPSQRVFKQRKPNWKTAGLKVRGKKAIELKKSYRNTVEILHMALRFANIPARISEEEDASDIDSLLLPEVDTTRQGDLPILKQCSSLEEQIDYILASIRDYVESGDYDWGDICILHRGFTKEFPLAFIPKFKQQFGERIYWVSENQQTKRLLDVSSSSVKLSTVASAKGMEFRVVFVVEMEQGSDDETNRSTAYVAITRAQDVLQIVYQNKSAFILQLEQIIASMSL